MACLRAWSDLHARVLSELDILTCLACFMKSNASRASQNSMPDVLGMLKIGEMFY